MPQIVLLVVWWCLVGVVLPFPRKIEFYLRMGVRVKPGEGGEAAVQVPDGRFLATQSRLLQRGCVVRNTITR